MDSSASIPRVAMPVPPLIRSWEIVTGAVVATLRAAVSCASNVSPSSTTGPEVSGMVMAIPSDTSNTAPGSGANRPSAVAAVPDRCGDGDVLVQAGRQDEEQAVGRRQELLGEGVGGDVADLGRAAEVGEAVGAEVGAVAVLVGAVAEEVGRSGVVAAVGVVAVLAVDRPT